MRSETCLFSYRPERNSTWNSSRTRLNPVLRHSVQPPLALVGFSPGEGQAHQPQPSRWEHGGASWRQTGTLGGAPASPSSPSVWPDSKGFPGGSDAKESACRAGDPGSNPWLGRSLGEGNGHPLQYSCLENPMHRGAWRATIHRVAKSWTPLK